MDTRTIEVLVGDRWEPCNFEDLNTGWVFRLRESTGEIVENADGDTVFEATEVAYESDGIMRVSCVPVDITKRVVQ